MAGITKGALDRMYQAAELEKNKKLKPKKATESGQKYLDRRQKAIDKAKTQAMKKGGIEAVKNLGLSMIKATPVGRAASIAVTGAKAISKLTKKKK